MGAAAAQASTRDGRRQATAFAALAVGAHASVTGDRGESRLLGPGNFSESISI